jgi:hypothetical protein
VLAGAAARAEPNQAKHANRQSRQDQVMAGLRDDSPGTLPLPVAEPRHEGGRTTIRSAYPGRL